MEILVVDAYFYPELTAFSHLEEDLLKGIIDAGHSVTVICPTPSRGIDKATARKYSKIKSETLYGGKVAVKRFYVPRERRNPILRALRYLLCNIKAYRTAKKLKNVDLIFSNSTPPIQGNVCIKIAKKLSKKYKRHVPFVYNLQDIFPDSLVNTGFTKKGSLIWKLGRKIEDKTYNGADKIIVISEDFKRNIMAKGVPENKIEVVYNWVDTEKIKPVERKDNKLFDEYHINRSDFAVVYAGNFGVSQGIKVVVDAAELLKNHSDIKFVLFGGGAEYEEIKKYAESLGLENVIINTLLPGDRISEVYSLGDVNLVVFKSGAGRSAMPSKTWSIMACGIPIIASFDTDSELARIIHFANAGISVQPENANELAGAILDFYALKQKSKPFIGNGRKYVEENASKYLCVNKYLQVFNDCLIKINKK